jgi:hypothetical protein
MIVKIITGSRNEELIAKVQAVRPFLKAEDGYDDLLYVVRVSENGWCVLRAGAADDSRESEKWNAECKGKG